MLKMINKTLGKNISRKQTWLWVRGLRIQCNLEKKEWLCKLFQCRILWCAFWTQLWTFIFC